MAFFLRAISKAAPMRLNRPCLDNPHFTYTYLWMEDRMAPTEWEDLLGSGVQKKVVNEGGKDEVSPELGSLVMFNWKGRTLLEDGTVGFAFAERARATARVGDGDQIPGLELALRHMRAGQQCLVRCESRFAYGPDGCPATEFEDKTLPPNTDIELSVELLEVLSTTSLSDMTLEETIGEARRRKIVGNEHFARTAFKKALRSYTSAHNTIAGLEIPDQGSDFSRDALRLQIDCGNNVATTCMRLEQLEKAKEAAVGVLELDSSNAKALFRAGQVSSLQSNFVEAKLALRKALDINPDSKEVQAELRILSGRIKAYNTKKRAMQETMALNLFAGAGRNPRDSQGDGSGEAETSGVVGQAPQSPKLVQKEEASSSEGGGTNESLPQGPATWTGPTTALVMTRYRVLLASVFVVLVSVVVVLARQNAFIHVDNH